MMESLIDPNEAFREALRAAQDFCLLLENIAGQCSESWLNAVAQAVEHLALAMAALPGDIPSSCIEPAQAMERRFELYLSLKRRLEPLDEFWSEADLRARDGIRSGSLAENLTDIYAELKDILFQHERGADTAEPRWRGGYREYWQPKLAETLRWLDEARTA